MNTNSLNTGPIHAVPCGVWFPVLFRDARPFSPAQKKYRKKDKRACNAIYGMRYSLHRRQSAEEVKTKKETRKMNEQEYRDAEFEAAMAQNDLERKKLIPDYRRRINEIDREMDREANNPDPSRWDLLSEERNRIIEAIEEIEQK